MVFKEVENLKLCVADPVKHDLVTILAAGGHHCVSCIKV